MRQALPPTPFEGLELGKMLSQSNGIKVYQGVYRGSPVVVRVRLARACTWGGCSSPCMSPALADWRT